MVRSYTVTFGSLPVTFFQGNVTELLVAGNAWNVDRDVQLHALCGDLQQRLDTHRFLADFGTGIDRLFSRTFQAWYLRKYHPELVPPPQQPGVPPSEKTLSTVFEFYYYRSILFSSEYTQLLPEFNRVVCKSSADPVYSSLDVSN
jgi:hypothetical protein